MFLFDFFRSFLPLHNPIGFGASDFIEFYLAAFLVLLFLARAWMEPAAAQLARRTVWSMVFLAALPIILRLLLLPHSPAPVADVADEFSHLFVAGTLRHFRLANPVHPMHRFFETFFILQEPSYSSIYPIGQGAAMALGEAIFRTPWAGVIAATGAFCALCYWMLRAWTTPLWALAGGLLAVMEFGPLSQWMNSYWGGALAAAGGCLVAGALPRLRSQWRKQDGALLGIGLAINLLTRPYESLFLILAAAIFLLPELRHRPPFLRPVAVAIAATLPAWTLILIQNYQVTGHALTMPYQLSQYQYGVPAALTFQANPTPHRALTPQQESEYQLQSAFHQGPETLRSFLDRLRNRIQYLPFFLLPPLFLAALFYLPRLREFRFAWVTGTLLLFFFGTNFFPAFHFHYWAASACLFLLVAVCGLEFAHAASPYAARLLLYLCFAHFAFWYTQQLFAPSEASLALRHFEDWDALNRPRPERRLFVDHQLASHPGAQLVFVRYSPGHPSQDEWVWNQADVDRARIVWARDLGAAENQKLLQYYPSRQAWLLEPDFRPRPRLTPYSPG